MGLICDALKETGIGSFCSLWPEEQFKGMSPDEIYDFCMKELPKSNVFLAFIKSDAESRGMNMELYEAEKLGKRVVVLIRE